MTRHVTKCLPAFKTHLPRVLDCLDSPGLSLGLWWLIQITSLLGLPADFAKASEDFAKLGGLPGQPPGMAAMLSGIRSAPS